MGLDMNLFGVNRKVEGKEELNDVISYFYTKDLTPRNDEEVEEYIEKRGWNKVEDVEIIEEYKKENKEYRKEHARLLEKYKDQDIDIKNIKSWRKFYYLDSLFEEIYERENAERTDCVFRISLTPENIKETIEKLKNSSRDYDVTIDFFDRLYDNFDFENQTLYYVSSQ
ncbi:MAG: hypothetical protein ACOCV1_07405 [Bacillota bacterium]